MNLFYDNVISLWSNLSIVLIVGCQNDLKFNHQEQSFHCKSKTNLMVVILMVVLLMVVLLMVTAITTAYKSSGYFHYGYWEKYKYNKSQSIE